MTDALNHTDTERDRRWSLTARHLYERAQHAEDLTDALVRAARAWKALLASSHAAARCAPQGLDGAALLSPSALSAAAGLEVARLGLPFRPEPWPFAPKPIPVLADQIVAANTYAMRPALRGPRVHPDDDLNQGVPTMSVLNRIKGAIAPVSLEEIRTRNAAARKTLAECEATYRRANLDAETGAGSPAAKQEAFDALTAARQRVKDLAAVEAELVEQERKRAAKAAADAEAAKDAAAAAKFDALIAAAKKLQGTMAAYVDDWAALNAAHNAAREAQKRPRVRADIASEHPYVMVEREMTRAACKANVPLPPGSSQGWRDIGNPADLASLLATIEQYAGAVKTALALSGPSE